MLTSFHAMRRAAARTRSSDETGSRLAAPSSRRAALMLVDGGLHGGLGGGARAGVFRLGVIVAPLAQLIGIALEVRMDVTGHQLVAALRRGPVRPVVGEEENGPEAAVRAFPQPLEVVHAVVRRTDAGQS